MEKTISTLRDAHNRYSDALAAVLAEFHDAGSYRIEGSAVQNLREQHEHFLSVLTDYEELQKEVDPIATEEVALIQDAASQAGHSLVLSSKGQGNKAHMSGVLGAAAGKALADLALGGASVPKETMGTYDMPAPEEAMVNQMATSQVLPDIVYDVCPVCQGLMKPL